MTQSYAKKELFYSIELPFRVRKNEARCLPQLTDKIAAAVEPREGTWARVERVCVAPGCRTALIKGRWDPIGSVPMNAEGHWYFLHDSMSHLVELNKILPNMPAKLREEDGTEVILRNNWGCPVGILARWIKATVAWKGYVPSEAQTPEKEVLPLKSEVKAEDNAGCDEEEFPQDETGSEEGSETPDVPEEIESTELIKT